MPMLISLFLGVFEFSWYFYNQQLVVSGLRDAARYMTRIELTDGNRDPCVQKDQNGVLYASKAANIATTAQTDAGGAARVSGWNAADVTINCLSSAALDDGQLRRRLNEHDDHRRHHPLQRSVARAVLGLWV